MYKYSNDILIIKDQNLSIDINCKIKLKKVVKKFKNITSESYYYKDLLYGPSTSYIDNILMSEGYYFKNMKVGTFKTYYKSKKICSIEKYVDGKLHKDQRYFYEDGTLKSLINYKNSILDNNTILYWPNGKIKRELYFENNKLINEYIYDENTKQINEDEFKI